MNSTPHQHIVKLFALADDEAVRLWPVGEKIHYRAPGPISPALRAAILANKPALLVALAEWDSPVVLRLMYDADETVAASGVGGTDMEIQRQADRCEDAHRRRDMAGVRAACALVEARVRELIANQTNKEAAA